MVPWCLASNFRGPPCPCHLPGQLLLSDTHVGSPADWVNRPSVLVDLGDNALHPPAALEEEACGPRCLADPAVAACRALLLADDGLTILASSETAAARCLLRGARFDRVQSRYARTF